MRLGVGEAAIAGGSAGQNSIRGSGQFSYEQGLQQAGCGKALDSGRGGPQCPSLLPRKALEDDTAHSPSSYHAVNGETKAH